MTSRATAVAAVLVLVATVACSPTEHARPPSGSASFRLTSTAEYGGSPGQAGITYQPDVVLIGGGSAAVRGVSDDSLHWTIDANAPGANRLAPGKVMFLTNLAVGRVATMARTGSALTVLLAPVELGDVIKDGEIRVAQSLDLADATLSSFPTEGGLVTAANAPSTAPSGAHSIIENAFLRPAALATGRSHLKVGEWDVGLSNSTDSVGMDIGYVPRKSGLVVKAAFEAGLNHPHVDTDFVFRNGQVQSGGYLYISGIDKIRMQLSSGATHGLSDNDNSNAIVRVPAQLTVQLPSEPVPLVFALSFTFIFETAFSAANSTLSVDGEFGLDGPLGIKKNGTGWTSMRPALSVIKSPIDSMKGLSLGVSGVVFAVRMRAQVGLGIPIGRAGPYAQVIVSTALTTGSAAGIVDCHQATVDLRTSSGFNLTFDLTQMEWLQGLFGRFAKYLPKIIKDVGATDGSSKRFVYYTPSDHVCAIS